MPPRITNEAPEVRIRSDTASIDGCEGRPSMREPTSRRTILRVLAAIPTASTGPTAPCGAALATLYKSYDDPQFSLERSRDGRQLSRIRYQRAENFFLLLGSRQALAQSDMLYQAGIVAQLALSAHLLDICFADQWCARWIGLRVAKALAYANSTGLGHDDPEMCRLATVLTPYCVWRQPGPWAESIPEDGGFTTDQVRPLLRALLDRVKSVTGHPRPKGWRHDSLECSS